MNGTQMALPNTIARPCISTLPLSNLRPVVDSGFNGCRRLGFVGLGISLSPFTSIEFSHRLECPKSYGLLGIEY
ncbi:MAG: hypothetical protein MK198_03285 [Gracilimonas sp.]|uniref:hypothetical protein n=1 Tax=Gracilimonas sp. TaxID=1974203 RepID=UPI00375191FC|nr:hypothetical protein [Gracilimonas sp.]